MNTKHRRLWTSAMLALAGLVPLGLLGGCAAPMVGLDVQVRDGATHQPLSGTTVIAEVPNNNHPKLVKALLGLNGPHANRGTTDVDGRVAMKYVPGRPVRVVVFPIGGAPAMGLLDPDDPDPDLGPWVMLDSGEMQGPIVEVHIEPAPQ